MASHYKTDRASFNNTARHWAQAYAGAPTSGGAAVSLPGGAGATTAAGAGRPAGGPGKAALAGLDEADVSKFVQMGFTEDQVVRARVGRGRRGLY